MNQIDAQQIENLVDIYNKCCEALHRWSTGEYILRYHLSRVAYHLAAIKSGHNIVVPSSHAVYDTKVMIWQTHNGMYVIYDNSRILNKGFWEDVLEILIHKKPLATDDDAIRDLSAIKLEKFEPACHVSVGINNQKYIVLGQYNKLREIITKTISLLDDFYYCYNRGLLGSTSKLNKSDSENAFANTETQDSSSPPTEAW